MNKEEKELWSQINRTMILILKLTKPKFINLIVITTCIGKCLPDNREGSMEELKAFNKCLAKALEKLV